MTGHWYIACFSHQLKRRPLARRILGLDLVLFRDAEGRAAALHDRCAHRHLALSRGRLTPQGLQCAYHGWTYDAAGRCTRIPASCDTACPFGDRPLVRAFVTREAQGLVHLFMPPAETPEAQPTTDPVPYPHLGEARWHHWFMERFFEGSAFQCVENFLDVPHTNHVHQRLFRTQATTPTELEISTGADWVQCQFLNERPMDSLLWRILLLKGQEIYHVDHFRLPYISRAEYRAREGLHYVVMSQCTPIDAQRTRVFTFIGHRVDGLNSLIGLFFRPMCHIILRQDIRVIAEQSADMARTGPPHYLYHPTDAMAREIRDLLAGKSLADRPPYRKQIAF
jgi:phenylpropionate dioxygenase-like ring-hydroxylating dioxygenase large terminal subunit